LGVLPLLDVLYTPDFLKSRSREPLFFRMLTSESAAIARPAKSKITPIDFAIVLWWIITFLSLTTPFIASSQPL
jgi:hypothetical protein